MSQHTPLERSRLWVSEHSVDRYRIFYPDKIGRDILDAIEAGVEVEWQTIWGFIGRKGIPTPGARYILHPERTGIFVVACEPDTRWDRIVTFLRFYGLQQHQEAARLWPGGLPVTACASWLAALQAPQGAQDPGPTEPSAVPVRPGHKHAPIQRNHANRHSRAGSAACWALKATHLSIRSDQFDQIGGFEVIDRLAREGAFRRQGIDWVAPFEGGAIIVSPRASVPTRFSIRLVPS